MWIETISVGRAYNNTRGHLLTKVWIETHRGCRTVLYNHCHLLTKVWIETSKFSATQQLTEVTFLRRCGLKPRKTTAYQADGFRVTFLRRCGLKHKKSVSDTEILPVGHLLTKVWIETGKLYEVFPSNRVTFLRRCGLKHTCEYHLWLYNHLVTFLRRCGLKLIMNPGDSTFLQESPSYEGVD